MPSTIDRLVLADLVRAGGSLPASRLPLSPRDLAEMARRGLVVLRRGIGPCAVTTVAIPR